MPTARKTRSGLQVYRRPGRQTLYLRGTIRGVRVFESAETVDAGLAEEVRARREHELFRADLHDAPPAVSFAAAAVSYLEFEPRSNATKIKVNKLITHFGPSTICAAIDQAAIDGAGKAICPGARPASRLRQVITPAKAVLNHAARRRWCAPPLFERVREGGRRTDWLRPAEAEAMVGAAGEKFRPLLIFLLCTGARVDEALGLVWADVDLTHGRAVFRATKNGDDRVLELPPRAVAALAGLKAPEDGKRIGAVFLTPKGKPYRRTNDARRGAYGNQIKRAFAACVTGAGLGRHVTPHVCRHSWATWHYAVYRDPFRLQDEGGWREVKMVRRYTKLAPAAMTPAIAAFWGVKVVPGIGARMVPLDEDVALNA